jgi:hypothetical protein
LKKVAAKTCYSYSAVEHIVLMCGLALHDLEAGHFAEPDGPFPGPAWIQTSSYCFKDIEKLCNEIKKAAEKVAKGSADIFVCLILFLMASFLEALDCLALYCPKLKSPHRAKKERKGRMKIQSPHLFLDLQSKGRYRKTRQKRASHWENGQTHIMWSIWETTDNVSESPTCLNH